MIPMGIDVSLHLQPTAKVHAQSAGPVDDRTHYLRIGAVEDDAYVTLWCASPEQAEALSDAALDLANRMRTPEERFHALYVGA